MYDRTTLPHSSVPSNGASDPPHSKVKSSKEDGKREREHTGSKRVHTSVDRGKVLSGLMEVHKDVHTAQPSHTVSDNLILLL